MERSISTLWRDILFLLLSAFVAALVLILPHINPPGRSDTDPSITFGNIMVVIRWPPGNVDVDLWVRAPGDVSVGYSNLNGRVFNLLRDDLGTVSDPLPDNFENAVSRGIPEGLYIINVHLYNLKGNPPPIKVNAVVWLRRVDGSSSIIGTREVELKYNGQEVTVMRFEIDENGNLIPDSIDHIPTPIRSSAPVYQP